MPSANIPRVSSASPTQLSPSPAPSHTCLSQNVLPLPHPLWKPALPQGQGFQKELALSPRPQTKVLGGNRSVLVASLCSLLFSWYFLGKPPLSLRLSYPSHTPSSHCSRNGSHWSHMTIEHFKCAMCQCFPSLREKNIKCLKIFVSIMC